MKTSLSKKNRHRRLPTDLPLDACSGCEHKQYAEALTATLFLVLGLAVEAAFVLVTPLIEEGHDGLTIYNQLRDLQEQARAFKKIGMRR